MKAILNAADRVVDNPRRDPGDHLVDGPGKLCQALGVTGAIDGTSVFGGPIGIGDTRLPGAVEVTPRVGISKATERPWRFVLSRGSP